MKKIPLTQHKYALVDDEDYELLNRFKWHYANGYARRNWWYGGKSHMVRMHHFVLPLRDGLMCDHINGNGIDNRKCNLRLVTKSQNMMNRGKQKNNTSGYMGVSLHRTTKKYRAFIKKDRKQIHLGLFETLREAAYAYNEAAKKYHGEFALLNKI